MISDNFGTLPYSSVVGCCCQDLFSMAQSILQYVPPNLSSNCFVRIHVVDPYTRTDSTMALKKFLFKEPDNQDLQIIVNLSRALQASATLVLTSFSVEHMLLPRWMNCSTFFKAFSLTVFISPFWL